MARLKNRQLQIPNGLRWYQPETKWSPRQGSSFQGIVESLIAHRKANPYLLQQHGWSVDPLAVADEVDAFNAAICERMGWMDYIATDAQLQAAGGQPTANPFLQNRGQPLLRRVGNVAAGSEPLIEWLASGEEAVPATVSEARAQTCAVCPKNGKGDLLQYFTRPAAAAIKAAYESRKGMKLSTTVDDKLGVCEACDCPLKLKCHLPMERVKQKLSKEAMDSLDTNCWILKPENP